MPQPIVRTMTLGDPKRGFTAYPIVYESGVGRAVDAPVVLKIAETFAIADGGPGRIFLTSSNYIVQVDKFDDKKVILTFLKKPKDAWTPSPVVADWLNQPFTRHLLGLKCTCKRHCPKCGEFLQLAEDGVTVLPCENHRT